ncbi:MAG TPA: hypothetical protein VF678_07410 [bacterium]
MPAQRKHKPPKDITMGPVTAAELAAIGLSSPAKIRALGWEAAFERWVERYPNRLNVNAAVGIVSVVDNVSWLKLPAARKAEARRVVEALRARFRRP